jgi:hypothetical protein
MAHKAFRQTLTAGVVLASAGAIALSPVTVTPEVKVVAGTPRVVATAVMPAGLMQDLQLIGTGAAAALQQSVDGLVRKVPDLWWTVEAQWPDADLTHWNYALVADIFLAPITPLIIGPLNDAVAEALARNFPIVGDQIRQIPDFIEYATIRLIGPLLSAIGGAGQAHAGIFYSMTTWRIEPFIEAIAKAPFHVIDGLLFGGYGDLGPILPGREGQYIPAPGLLTPWGTPPPVRDIKTPNDIVDTTLPGTDSLLVDLVADLGTPNTQDLAPTDTLTALPAALETTVPAAILDVEPAVVDDEVAPVSDESPAATPGPLDPVAPEAETPKTEAPKTEAGAEVSDTPAAAKPGKATKPGTGARNGLRQGIKDFQQNVHNTVKKITGGNAAPPGTPAGTGPSGISTGSAGSSDSGSTGGSDSE